ncbi:phosphatase PAP2 family protein [Persephonella sp.]
MKKSIIILSIFFTFSTAISEEKSNNFRNFVYFSMPIIIFSFILDVSINEISQNNKTETFDDFFSFFNQFGDKYILVIPISGYFYGKYSDNEKLERSSAVAFVSSVVAAGVSFPLKIITGRERPDRSDKSSFPSGHTAISFAVFGSYARYYKEGVYPYIFYSVPIMVGLSRIYKNKHYFSDVVTGGVIGLGSVYVGEYLVEKFDYKFPIFLSYGKSGFKLFFMNRF